MKLRLMLVALLFIPFLVNAQKGEPKSGIIVYSKGKMYVAPKSSGYDGTKTESTSMYIDGSAKFTTEASIQQEGRTEITGDFVNAKNPAVTEPGTESQLFINNPTTPLQGVIAFVGKPINGKATRQWIYGETLDWTTTTAWSLDAQKKSKYINFPSISIEKGLPGDADDWREVGVVTIDQSAAVKVDYLKVNAASTERNRLEVRADYTTANDISVGYLDIKNLSGMSALDIATYSQVDFNLYNYQEGVVDDGAFLNESGPRPTADPATWGSGRGTLRREFNGNGWNYLVGFAPPFGQLGADYMFYHPFTKPAETSITSWEGPIVDPFFRMKSGRGYFMSMEVSHADHKDHIDVRWDFEGDKALGASQLGIHNSKRARGGYVFNRMVFHDFLSAPTDWTGLTSTSTARSSMDNFSRFVYDSSLGSLDASGLQFTSGDAYSGYSPGGNKERPLKGWAPPHISDIIEDGKDRSRYEYMDQEVFVLDDVQVDLVQGLNFLGNPFMTPISLNPLLGLDENGDPAVLDSDNGGDGSLESGFPVSNYFGSGILASTENPNVQLRAKYWVINQALIRYNDEKNIFEYLVTYDYASRKGATTITRTVDAGDQDNDPDANNATVIDVKSNMISPMQMFCLQAGVPTTITLKKELRQMGKSRIPKSASDNSLMQDWFVVEAYNQDRTFTDRTSVAFTDRLMYLLNNPYETPKGITKELGDAEQKITDQSGVKTSTQQGIASNVIYTKSKDGSPLLGNAVMTKTKEMALYFNTPEVTQDVTLRFYGIENLESVPGVWLVDRVLNTTTKIDADTEYTFVSNPSETKSLSGENNRFILRFYPSEEVIVPGNSEISCYYESSTLGLIGLNEDDINSDLTIYDIQGRLMGRTKVTVDGDGRMRYFKPLGIGTYIVKIAGKRNYTTKFVSLRQ